VVRDRVELQAARRSRRQRPEPSRWATATSHFGGSNLTRHRHRRRAGLAHRRKPDPRSASHSAYCHDVTTPAGSPQSVAFARPKKWYEARPWRSYCAPPSHTPRLFRRQWCLPQSLSLRCCRSVATWRARAMAPRRKPAPSPRQRPRVAIRRHRLRKRAKASPLRPIQIAAWCPGPNQRRRSLHRRRSVLRTRRGPSSFRWVPCSSRMRRRHRGSLSSWPSMTQPAVAA